MLLALGCQRRLYWPSERLEIYTDEQEKLVVQIEALGDAHGGTVHIWDGAV